MNVWYWSDQHFNHKNIIKYCNRSFNTKEEMNAWLINVYNQKVKPTDVVYFLGDTFFCGINKAQHIMSKLQGYKILIKGNHDHGPNKMKRIGFDEVYYSLTKTIGNYEVNLCHFPYIPSYAKDLTQQQAFEKYKNSQDMLERDFRHWEHKIVDDGKPLICGHVHDNWIIKDKMINVGVDALGQDGPVSEQTIKSYLEMFYE